MAKANDIIKRKKIVLPDIEQLIDSAHPSRKNFYDPPKHCGGFFQSPVSKLAFTLDDYPNGGGSFRFNSAGGLEDGDSSIALAMKAIEKNEWAESAGARGIASIEKWLRTGAPLDPSVLQELTSSLAEGTLTNHDMYNQPICRLVRGDQLRFDPNYQAIYQLTPAQSRLLDLGVDIDLNRVADDSRLNQRLYWGVSEAFQSLVAMFDSDLGSRKGDSGAETREFIRIQEAKERLGPTPPPKAPDELGTYSPLRFWSPPPAFSRCVFHMLFWRSVITGKDLFHRPIEIDEPKSAAAKADRDYRIRSRAGHYFVIVNWFNAATFRIAEYAKLVNCMAVLARVLPEGDKPVHTYKDRTLPKTGPTQDFYPIYFPNSHVKFPEFKSLSLILPFRSARSPFWELALHYQPPGRRSKTKMSELRKFLRDRTLELILWSKYQMEIRSVGMIPVQHLYRIELTASGCEALRPLEQAYALVETLDATNARRQDAEAKINNAISAAVASQTVNDWVELEKVYGGMHRDIVEKDLILQDRIPPPYDRRKIEWLLPVGSRARVTP